MHVEPENINGMDDKTVENIIDCSCNNNVYADQFLYDYIGSCNKLQNAKTEIRNTYVKCPQTNREFVTVSTFHRRIYAAIRGDPFSTVLWFIRLTNYILFTITTASLLYHVNNVIYYLVLMHYSFMLQ